MLTQCLLYFTFTFLKIYINIHNIIIFYNNIIKKSKIIYIKKFNYSKTIVLKNILLQANHILNG